MDDDQGGPKMQGIPIDELIAWNEKLRKIDKNAIDAGPATREPAILTPADVPDELAFIKAMETDFTVQAESLLETLHLSHLRASAQKSA